MAISASYCAKSNACLAMSFFNSTFFFISFSFEDLEDLDDFDLLEVISDNLGSPLEDFKLLLEERGELGRK